MLFRDNLKGPGVFALTFENGFRQGFSQPGGGRGLAPGGRTQRVLEFRHDISPGFKYVIYGSGPGDFAFFDLLIPAISSWREMGMLTGEGGLQVCCGLPWRRVLVLLCLLFEHCVRLCATGYPRGSCYPGLSGIYSTLSWCSVRGPRVQYFRGHFLFFAMHLCC